MKYISNIFSPINKTNGNFLLFSQYVEDVSNTVVNSAYRVRPSKFICMNFDTAVQQNASNDNQSASDVESYIPGFLQNYFENGIAALKDTQDVSPLNFSIGFIDKLVQMTRNGSNRINLQSYIKYIGDIDLESWSDGFADIILDINSGAVGNTYKLKNQVGGVTVDTLTYDQFSIQCCGKQTYNNEQGIQHSGYFIRGWRDNMTPPISPIVDATGAIGVTQGNIWADNTPVINQLVEIDSSVQPANEFTFNTILILYDVVDASNSIIYSGIPMGLYFTGAGVNGGVNNGVTIKNSSDTAYGAGSGWSLRICTKFSPTPYGNLQVEEVALESKAISSSISALMSATAEAIKSVKAFTESNLVDIQTLKELYSNFKNTRTNVPYVKTINNVGYWFVNGRNTGVRIDGTIE